VSTLPSGPVDRDLVFIPTRPLTLFMRVEARSSVLLLSATVIALAWANSPWLVSYEVLWTTNLSVRVGEAELAKDLRHWVNDGLMTLFFLVMGLELTRELKLYERRHWSAAIVPTAGALGGLIVPGLVYLAFNAAGPAARGWAIVAATDLALVLGVLALAGPRCPPQLRAVVLMVALVDGLAVVALVAVLYPELVNLIALAVVLELFAVIAVLRLLRVLRTLAYLVAGVALWVAMSLSGLHPAIAGVVLGVVITTFPPLPIGAAFDAGLARLLERDQSPVTIRGADGAAPPNERLQELLHPWSSYLIVPLFALANAGVTLDRDLLARAVGSPITLGVIMGWWRASCSGSSAPPCSRPVPGWGPCRAWSPTSSWRERPRPPGSGSRSHCFSLTSPWSIGRPRTKPRSASWSPRGRRPPLAGSCSPWPVRPTAATDHQSAATRRVAAPPQQARGDQTDACTGPGYPLPVGCARHPS
jgi:Na+/H+ antiporter NhaA